jgi:hypothetical protein
MAFLKSTGSEIIGKSATFEPMLISSAAVRMSSVPKPKIRPNMLWSSRASLIFSRLVSVTLLLSTPSARMTLRVVISHSWLRQSQMTKPM